MGCNIIYDRKEGVVKKDGVIIDRLQMNFQEAHITVLQN